MEAKLKGILSPDIDDLENYHPEDPTCFGFLLRAMVGPADEEGQESFDIEVCTPKWLEKTYRSDDVVVGRHHLIVREYNFDRIVGKINNFVRSCSGKDWDEVAAKVSRLGYWEFEDYADRRD